MTKEELEKEANEYAKEIEKKYIFMDYGRASALGYLAGAEPREKRIAELTEQNTSLLTSVENLNKSVQELEKDKAELKEKKIKGCYFGKDELGNDFFAKCDCVDCQKRTIALLDLRKEYLNKINKEKTINDQLTNAKEIIRKLVLEVKGYEEINGYDTCEPVQEAEQFLKDLEK